jgi:branched-chain amino acid transport system permease protein
MELLLQLVLNGIVIGSIYALVGLGFVIIYKSSSILNFAQGEFLMLGAYVCLAAFSGVNVPLPVAFAITLVFSAVLGVLMERVLLRPMIGEPVISVIMLTLGLASVLRAVVQGIWGTDLRPYPEIFPTTPVRVGPLPVSQGTSRRQREPVQRCGFEGGNEAAFLDPMRFTVAALDEMFGCRLDPQRFDCGDHARV